MREYQDRNAVDDACNGKPIIYGGVNFNPFFMLDMAKKYIQIVELFAVMLHLKFTNGNCARDWFGSRHQTKR